MIEFKLAHDSSPIFVNVLQVETVTPTSNGAGGRPQSEIRLVSGTKVAVIGPSDDVAQTVRARLLNLLRSGG